MTRRFYSSNLIFSAALFLNMLSSCDKDQLHKRQFEATMHTWYRVSPTVPAPVDINGETFTAFAFFPGSGSGNATHLGNCSFYFNQLVYITSPEAPPTGSVAAPVSDVPAYPVTGAQLPLIQAGDFSRLAAAVLSLNIPPAVHGRIINGVFDNGKGDAIFTSGINESETTYPVSDVIVGFKGKALIVGGRGKFAHAAGEADFEGYFNITNANDAEYSTKGWISY